MIYVYDDQGREELLCGDLEAQAHEKDFKLKVDCSDSPSVTARAARLLGKSGYEPNRVMDGKWFYLFRTGTERYLAVVRSTRTSCRVCDTTDEAWYAFGEPFWANKVFKDAKLSPPTIEV